LAIYQHLGSGPDVEIQELQLTMQYHDYQDMLANREPNPERARALAASIETRLESDQENIQYWFMLARTYMGLSDFVKAANAYQQVVNRDKQSGMVLAETAQAIFLRDGNRISPPVEDLTKAALVLEPDNTMALGLMGIVSFNHKNYLEAIKHWQQAIAIMGVNSGGAESLSVGITRAKNLYLAEGGSADALDAQVAGRQLKVSVSLGKGIKANPEHLVYIYARAWKGPKMPLAITRIKVSELPQTITLTEAMAMSPAASLATATEIELVARVSQDGTATAKEGDWQGSLGPIDMKSIPADMAITIDKAVTP
jgi:cytochrome c-type biogenesis protein CcmH